MPELPEVETIRQGLEQALTRHRIISVTVNEPKLFQGNKNALINQRVISINRRAKILLWRLEKCWLVIHLKMTGQLIFRPKEQPTDLTIGGHPDEKYSANLPHQYTHIIIGFDHGTLFYNDLRKFGWMKICTSKAEVDRLTQEIGPEYNDQNFTLDYLKQQLARRPKIKIKQFLLDQKVVAGLGNIYSDEVLFCAGVSPLRTASSISPREATKIYDCITKVLNLALRHGGSTLKDFRHINGGYGSYLSYAQVYGKAKQPCKICQTHLKSVKIGGRTATFCPNCQR